MLTLFFLLTASPSVAGVFLPGAILEPCQQADLHVSDKSAAAEQVKQIKHYGHKQIATELKTSIQARKTLLACLDKPQDKDCAARVSLLRSQLENNVRRLRIALALANIPQVANDRSVSPHIHLPGSLGGAELPSLSDSEAEMARAFQKAAVAAAERVGLEKLRADHNLAAGAGELVAKCRAQDPAMLETCPLVKGVHEASFLQFRASMGKIVGNIIADLPLSLSFRSAPISDDELKKQLQISLDTLKAWKDDNGDIDEDDDSKWSNFLSDNLAYTEQYVALHPEACAAAEQNLRATGRMQFAKDALTAVTDVTAVTVVCSVATPWVCISASAAVLGKDTHTAYGEWSQLRRRLTAADRENPQANQVSAADSFRDLVSTIALDSIQVQQYAAWALKGGDDFYPLKDFIKALERRHPKYAKVAGEMFSTLFDNVKDDIPEAIGTTMGETAIANLHAAPAGSYEEWLRSDAFTARVFEAFEKRENGR